MPYIRPRYHIKTYNIEATSTYSFLLSVFYSCESVADFIISKQYVNLKKRKPEWDEIIDFVMWLTYNLKNNKNIGVMNV